MKGFIKLKGVWPDWVQGSGTNGDWVLGEPFVLWLHAAAILSVFPIRDYGTLVTRIWCKHSGPTEQFHVFETVPEVMMAIRDCDG